MPTFVVLEHDHPELHWDFMLEHGGVLKTWRLPASWPAAGQKLPALALADHRLQYLDYEGPVSGDRGRVVRRDRGSYQLLNGRAEPRERSELTHSDPLRGSARQDEDPFQDGQVCLSLGGSGLCGIFVLERLEGNSWQLERLGCEEAI